MGIKLRINKGTDKGAESIGISGGLLSGVTGKIILRTPFGRREVAPDGSLKGGKVKTAEIKVEPESKIATSKPTTKPKKGSK